jgi:hypothetical protein
MLRRQTLCLYVIFTTLFWGKGVGIALLHVIVGIGGEKKARGRFYKRLK